MSSFAGNSFKVIPNGSFYPGVEATDDGIRYKASVVIPSKATRNGLANKLSIVTWRRPLGTMSFNGHVEAGYGTGTLIVPSAGGVALTFTAVLVSMTNVEGYGREITDEYQADLEFVITGSAYL